MDVRPPLVPDLQPTVLVDGRDRPLDHTSVSPQPTPVRLPGPGEGRPDGPPPERPLATGRPVRAVAQQLDREAARPPVPGQATTVAKSTVTSRALAALPREARGTPFRSTVRWCLVPFLPRSCGSARHRPPKNGPNSRRVDHALGPFELAGVVQPFEEGGVDSAPGPVGLPGGQPPPAMASRTRTPSQPAGPPTAAR